MEGYLYKRGRGRNFAFVKPWAQRYFILDVTKYELSYFIVEKGIKRKRGTINIKGCQIIETTIDTSGKPFSFEIRSDPNTVHEEVISLSASDEYTLIAWCNMLSLNGEVKWQPGRTLPMTKQETGLPGLSGRNTQEFTDDVSMSSDEETFLEGEVFKKTPVSSQLGGGVCGGIWVRRGFSLDTEVGVLSFYNEVGARQCLVKSLSVVAGSGSVQEALEASTGRPHSFILKCRAKSLASNDEIMIIATPDADTKARLVTLLCRALQCPPSPAAATALSAQSRVATLSLIPLTEDPLANIADQENSPEVHNTISLAADNMSGNTNSSSKNIMNPKIGRSTNSGQEELSKFEVVQRDRAAKLKLQAEKISQLRLKEEARKRADINQSSLDDVIVKIQNRIKHVNVDASYYQDENQAKLPKKNVSDRMVLAKKKVQKENFPEQHIKTHMEKQRTTQERGSSRNVCIDPEKDIDVEVIKVLTPAKNMRKYLFVKELFVRSTTFVDYDVVQKKILEFESDYLSMPGTSEQTEDDFVHLPVGGCTLADLGQYIDQCEQRQSGGMDEVYILIGVQINTIGYSRKIPCSLDAWAPELQGILESDLKSFSIDDILLQAVLERKGVDVLRLTSEQLARDELEIQKYHYLMAYPSEKSMLISQVVRNHEQRARARASLSEPVPPPSHPPTRRGIEQKRLAPTPPFDTSFPAAAAISCIRKNKSEETGFSPPPRRQSARHYASADTSMVSFDNHGSRVHISLPPPPPPPRDTTAAASSGEGGGDTSARRNTTCTSCLSLPELCQCDTILDDLSPSKNDAVLATPTQRCHRASSVNCYLVQSPNANEENDNNSIMDRNALIMDHNDVKLSNSFKGAIFKNKWCKNSIKRLASMEKMNKILCRGGKVGSVSRIGMSVLWLEAIATKLGTFLPLSEREFMVEAMYRFDPDAQNHVHWFSALLLSLWESPEALESKRHASGRSS